MRISHSRANLMPAACRRGSLKAQNIPVYVDQAKIYHNLWRQLPWKQGVPRQPASAVKLVSSLQL